MHAVSMRSHDVAGLWEVQYNDIGIADIPCQTAH